MLRDWWKDRGDGFVLLLLWLVAALVDRLWFALDNTPLGWDQGDHLTRALTYLQHLQQPDLLSGSWWRQLWLLSPTYRGPFFYLLASPLLALFGRGPDQAALVNLMASALLVVSVYALGRRVFDRATGLWAAAVALLVPAFAYNRTDLLLDYTLSALVGAAFTTLVLWRFAERGYWRWALLFALALGAAILTKPTALLFLLLPLGWAAGGTLVRRQWGRLGELVMACVLAVGIALPWLSTNWLTILTSGDQANRIGAFEGDPTVGTLAAWLYYPVRAGDLLGWPLLVLPLVGWLWSLRVRGNRRATGASWLALFLVGNGVLVSLIANKDDRYVLPLLPVGAVVLARGLSRAPWPLGGGAAMVAAGVLATNLLPVAGAKHPLQAGPPWPLAEAVDEVVRRSPHLRTNVGVVAHTPQVNVFAIDALGAIADFRVYGRGLGMGNFDQLDQDVRALDWYLVQKTDDPKLLFSFGKDQIALIRRIEASPALAEARRWTLPDGSTLVLYRRQSTSVEAASVAADRVRLVGIDVPAVVRPGVPVPVTYTWQGPAAALADTIALVEWSKDGTSIFHDHAIGLGRLVAEPGALSAVERLAMLPPTSAGAGEYRPRVLLLARGSGTVREIAAPSVSVRFVADALPPAAPEPDPASVLRALAGPLRRGELDPVFREVGRINQYDPTQDYLNQLEASLGWRLARRPTDLDLAYALTLVHVLHKDADRAAAVLEQVTRRDPHNPHAWSYLGFVHLYAFRGAAAEAPLRRAETLDPRSDTIRKLLGVAALMQGRLPEAWERLR